MYEKWFKKPKYVIYAGILLIWLFWTLHATIIPDVKTTDVGTVRKGMRVKSIGFSFSAQMDTDSTEAVNGIIEIYFDDTTKVPNDLLLAADYPDSTLRDVSVSYAYSLDGKQYSGVVKDTSINLRNAIGGAGFRQPFPSGAKNRCLTFRQTADSSMDSLSAEGYIAEGNELHHCDMADGVLNTINARKAFRIGNVQLVKFAFQKQN